MKSRYENICFTFNKILVWFIFFKNYLKPWKSNHLDPCTSRFILHHIHKLCMILSNTIFCHIQAKTTRKYTFFRICELDNKLRSFTCLVLNLPHGSFVQSYCNNNNAFNFPLLCTIAKRCSLFRQAFVIDVIFVVILRSVRIYKKYYQKMLNAMLHFLWRCFTCGLPEVSKVSTNKYLSLEWGIVVFSIPCLLLNVPGGINHNA